ncbi:MAG: YbgC/FadM family acyl-CoA thioesterase [Alphaproteobacteria bacterium]|nr:MAG: YbgC/FadM family acyl-CoA thioesterase [Alphaproteobacteria bacterium]
MSAQVSVGAWNDGVFQFPMRVYYEDTDMGGMVYHGRYVSFFERVRTESIRGTDADVDALMAVSSEDGGPLVYVVSNLNISYRQQARIGDVLMGHSMVKRVRAAAVEVKQWISRDDQIVAEAELLVAVIGPDGRPRRWPQKTRAAWERWMNEAQEQALQARSRVE